MVANREITLHIVLKGCDAAREKRKILISRKPDLRGGKQAKNMIVEQHT